jgi:S1-C subfamily serine protease
MKNNSKHFQIWMALAMLTLAILACGPTPAVVIPTQQAQATPEKNTPANTGTTTVTSRADLIAATVQIFGVHIKNGTIKPFYVGSGSLISADGLILTNAHVADPAYVGEPDSTPDALVIGIVQSEDQPPVYSYRAEVKAIDGYMDLAVIQVTSTVKGDSLDPSSLNLPYVPLGNSDNVHVGDHINILGFPAIGGNTITYTSGDVAGFSAEEKLGDRAWIKTDATISGGNSGGMGTNDQGQLIGVPSIASSGNANTEATDCRVIQDTNGDGTIDNKDTCIPIGGFINALRPINLALPLIKAAQGGLAYTSPYTQQTAQGEAQPTGNEQMSQITWFTVDNRGNLGDQVTAYPGGTTDIVAAFKFSGFVNGEPWSETWTLGGQTVYSGSYAWDQGSDGTYGTSLSNQGNPLDDGTYHLELFAGDGKDPLTQSDVVVGSGSSQPQPSTKSGVRVSGTVTDKDTGNPIPGTYVMILNPGVKYTDFVDAGYPKADILMYTQTDSNGQYVLPKKLARNTSYTLVASAQGYYDAYGDDLVWDDQKPSDFTMDISLTK